MKHKVYYLLLLFVVVGMGLTECKKDDGPTLKVITLQPGPESGKDAVIYSVYPDQNAGNANMLRAEVSDTGTTASIVRGLLEFDLSILSDQAEILLAELSLYYYDPDGNPHHSTTGPNVGFIKRITESWDESTVTWNNQPASTDNNQFLIHDTTEPQENLLGLDITNVMKDILANRNQSHGLLIKLEIEEGSKGLYLASSDHMDPDFRPMLILTVQE